MTDDVNEGTELLAGNVEEVENKEEDVQPVKNPEAIMLQNDVKEAIKGKQEIGAIREKVVTALVEEEVNHRADLLAKALAKRKAQAKELDKIRPDQCTFNQDGSPANQHWSKSGLGERQKAEKTLAKIDKAINAAVQNADYEGLRKIAQ